MNLQIPKQAKRWAATAAGAALLTLSVPYAAQAGSQSYAEISYSNFEFRDHTNGGVLQLGIDIVNPIAVFNDTAINSAVRTGGPGSVNAAVQFDVDTNVNDGVFLDAAMACIGPGCGAGTATENTSGMGLIGSEEYTRSDSLVIGSGLDISAAFGNAPGTNVDTAMASHIAESIAQGTIGAGSSSTLTNTTKFTITPATNLVLGLSFDAVTDLLVTLDPATHLGANGNANVNFDLTLTDDATGFAVALDMLFDSPNALDEIIANSTPGATVTGGQLKSMDIRTAAALVANQSYTLGLTFTANHTLNTEVPEPGMLAMMGLGLLGFSLRLRGKKA